MFRIALCDDCLPFLEYEKRIVDEYFDGGRIDYICDLFKSGDGFLKNGEGIRKYDLIILDYEMDGLTGFDTARSIYEIFPDARIAFATNFYDFTREGYKYRAIRYLVKQEKSFESDLHECLEYVINLKLEKKGIVLKLYDSSLSVDINDIVYIKSEDHYVFYHIKGKDTNRDHLIRRCSLDDAYSELTEKFIRIHQSYVVNVKYAMRVTNCKIEIRNEKNESMILPISRSKSNEVYRKYCLLKGASL